MAKAKSDDDPILTTYGGGDAVRTVRMPSGKLTFTLDVNLLKCSPEDRTFLFGIIDQLDAYERTRAAAEAAAATAAAAQANG